LSKKQLQLEQAHAMLLKHHEKTQDLEYRQQKSVHALREEQVNPNETHLIVEMTNFRLFFTLDFQTTRE
jgi:hypothetical protein